MAEYFDGLAEDLNFAKYQRLLLTRLAQSPDQPLADIAAIADSFTSTAWYRLELREQVGIGRTSRKNAGIPVEFREELDEFNGREQSRVMAYLGKLVAEKLGDAPTMPTPQLAQIINTLKNVSRMQMAFRQVVGETRDEPKRPLTIIDAPDLMPIPGSQPS